MIAALGFVRRSVSSCHALRRLGSTAVEILPTERSGLSAIAPRVASATSCATAASAALEALEAVIEKLENGKPGAGEGHAGLPIALGEYGSSGGSTIEASGVSGSGSGAEATGRAPKSGLSSTGRSFTP